MKDRTRTLVWIGAGFLFFGGATAFITGISMHPGISDTLLTSVSAFAGGSILTFAGFKLGRKTGAEEARVDVEAVGIALTLYSVGLIAGISVGALVRATPPPEPEAPEVAVPAPSAEVDAGEATPPAQNDAGAASHPNAHGGGGIFVYSDTDTCRAVRRHRSANYYEGVDGVQRLAGDLESLMLDCSDAGGAACAAASRLDIPRIEAIGARLAVEAVYADVCESRAPQ